MIRGVVFDLDGTLVDSYAAIGTSLNAARAHFGLAAHTADEVRELVGWGLERLLAQSLGAERVEEAAEVFRVRYREVLVSQTELLPGAVETLQRLADRGFQLGVATNKPHSFSVDLIAGLGLGAWIGSVRGAAPGLAHKPAPDLLRAVLADLGLAPGEARYVGDMEVDAETGRAAGVGVYLVATGARSAESLGAIESLGVLGSLRELLPALGVPARPDERSEGSAAAEFAVDDQRR